MSTAYLMGQLGPRALPPATTQPQPLAAPPQTGAEHAQLLHGFEPIGLAELDRVALQDRSDTKFVLHVSGLQHILAALSERARILEIDGQRLHKYRTLYFDTADFALYRSHHSGSRNRFKVRSRWYASTDRAFLETKLKTNTDRTIKHRMPTREIVTRLNAENSAFVHAHLPAETQQLAATLWNEFRRITLVSKQQHERLTIDLGLQYSNDGRMLGLPPLAIVELKQAVRSHDSDFLRVLRKHNVRSTPFSKYCIGVSLLYPDIKHNNFKELHRLLGRLMQGDVRDAD